MSEQKVTRLKEAEKPFLPLRSFFTAMSVLLVLQLLANLGISIWNELRYLEDAMADDMPTYMALVQNLINLLVVPITILIAVVCSRFAGIRSEARSRRLLLLWTFGYLWVALCQLLAAVRYAIFYTLAAGDLYSGSLGDGSIPVFVLAVSFTLLLFTFWMCAEHPFFLGAAVVAAVIGVIACVALPAMPMSAQELSEASTISLLLEACSTNIHYLLTTVVTVAVALHLKRAAGANTD